MKDIVITGATGYIGRHLVQELIRQGGWRVKILSRTKGRAAEFARDVEIVEGDLRAPESFRDFFEPGCVVVNLVYLREAGEAVNLTATRNLLEACQTAKVCRLIHCSTADVTGRAPGTQITEASHCQPLTEYARTKFAVEQAVLDAARAGLDAIILRPTAVFGPAGTNLRKLADDLALSGRWRNYLKSCLFGRRRMNQVHVRNVVAAIMFLAQRVENLSGEIFLVSDDESPANNFADVERVLMQSLHLSDYPLPRIALPTVLLRNLLRLLGKDNINPLRNFDSSKLQQLGFTKPICFEDGLVEYAAWYAAQHAAPGTSK